MNRRNFLKLGSLFVPAVVAPTVAYSFCGGWSVGREIVFVAVPTFEDINRFFAGASEMVRNELRFSEIWGEPLFLFSSNVRLVSGERIEPE